MSGQLVEQWPLKTLGELFDITSSKRVFKSEWKESGVPFYRAREIVKLAKQGFVDNDLFISREMFEQYTSTKGAPQEGDIMVTGVGTLGICYVVKEGDEFYFKDGNIIWLKNKGLVNPRYVEYAFQSNFLRKQIDNSMGATVGTYTIIKAKNTLIPVPSMEEQQRIVSILDEAFNNLEIANVSSQDGITNVQRLFDSQFNQLFSVNEEKGTRYSMSEICSITSVLVDPKQEEFQDLIHVGGANIVAKSGKLIKLKTAVEEGLKSGKFVFDSRMVLYSKIRPYLMKVVRPDFEGLCSADIYPLVCNEEIITRDYLFYLLLSPDFTHFAIQGSARAGMPKVNRKHLFSYETIIPALEVQNRITRSLDELAERTEKMYSVSAQKIQAIAELKQSILQEAFNGTLQIAEGLAGQS